MGNKINIRVWKQSSVLHLLLVESFLPTGQCMSFNTISNDSFCVIHHRRKITDSVFLKRSLCCPVVTDIGVRAPCGNLRCMDTSRQVKPARTRVSEHTLSSLSAISWIIYRQTRYHVSRSIFLTPALGVNLHRYLKTDQLAALGTSAVPGECVPFSDWRLIFVMEGRVG